MAEQSWAERARKFIGAYEAPGTSTEHKLAACVLREFMTLFEQVDLLDKQTERIKQLEGALENWIQSAAKFARDAEYYRGLVERIGRALGPDVYTADDNSKSDTVLCAKVPELVERMCAQWSPSMCTLAALRSIHRVTTEFDCKHGAARVPWCACCRIRDTLEKVARDTAFNPAEQVADDWPNRLRGELPWKSENGDTHEYRCGLNPDPAAMKHLVSHCTCRPPYPLHPLPAPL